jgi:hypothetical protein
MGNICLAVIWLAVIWLAVIWLAGSGFCHLAKLKIDAYFVLVSNYFMSHH